MDRRDRKMDEVFHGTAFGTHAHPHLRQMWSTDPTAESFAFHRGSDIRRFDRLSQRPAVRKPVDIRAVPHVAGVQSINGIDPQGFEVADGVRRIVVTSDQRAMLAECHSHDRRRTKGGRDLQQRIRWRRAR